MAKYIPEKHYITWGNFAEEFPLAFMTVYGTDQAAKNRMATADSWVKNNKGVLPVKNTWDNEPLKGFKISEEVRRWSTSNVLWRINDPRGFQLEISSGNMAYLLGLCDIVKGVIQEELMWVRDGKDNYLLPTNSDEFKTYERNSKAKVSNTKISEVNVGDRISLLTGEEGIYLGMYSCVQLGSRWGDDKIIATKRYHIVRDESDGDEIRYVAKTTWKGISIDKRNDAEDKDYSDEINENIADLHTPNNAHYVCKNKFNVKDALLTVDKITYDPNTHKCYFLELNDVLYRGTHRHQGNWEGTIIPFFINAEENSAETDYSMQTDVSQTETRLWGNRKRIHPDKIKNLEKFVYAVCIDKEIYVLDL